MCKEGSGRVVFVSLKPVMSNDCGPVSNVLLVLQHPHRTSERKAPRQSKSISQAVLGMRTNEPAKSSGHYPRSRHQSSPARGSLTLGQQPPMLPRFALCLPRSSPIAAPTVPKGSSSLRNRWPIRRTVGSWVSILLLAKSQSKCVLPVPASPFRSNN